MKLVHELRSILEAKVSRDKFISALGRYIEDNYNSADLGTIKRYKSETGVEKGSHLTVYRGLFLPGKRKETEKKKTFMSTKDDISWTTNLDEAFAFASGDNIFSFNKSKINLQPNDIGIVLRRNVSLRDIIIDLQYVLKNKIPEYKNLDIIEENEVIVSPKKQEDLITHMIIKDKIHGRR